MSEDSKTLALRAIAGMRVTETTDHRAALALCMAIAQIELAQDFDIMLSIVEAAIVEARA